MDTLSIEHFYKPDNIELGVFKLTGYIDSTNSIQLDETLEEAYKSGKNKIIFDFSEVAYVSSAGWGVFVGRVKGVREQGGDIRIASMVPEVYEVFNILEFYHIISHYDTLGEAVQSFSQKEETKPAQKDDAKRVFEPIDNLLRKSGVNRAISSRNTAPEKKVILVQNRENNTALPVKSSTNQRGGEVKRKSPLPVSQPSQKSISVSILPLNERLKKVVVDHPLLSIRQLRKILRRDEYGNIKIGLIKLRRVLKKLNLQTKEKRYRYYLST